MPKVKLLVRPYEPWWAQRWFHRSTAPIRSIVAGRQTGKTHAAAEEVVDIICRRPNTESCLLMPTYKSTKGALRHLKRALKPLGNRVRFKVVEAMFEFWNGAKLYIRTADDKSGVPTRGLTLDGVLWMDEAAYLPEEAVDAARLTQAAVADPLVIITTTPCGNNWCKREWEAGMPPTEVNESFRFRSLDSPFTNPEFVEDMREKLGARKAMQELNAQFLGDSGAALDSEDIRRLIVDRFAIRGEEMVLGIDLAKEVDYTVLTLMNEFGETWIVSRFKNVKWPDVEKRIISVAQEHQAVCIVDIGHGGGFGGSMFDYLERALGKARVMGVRTGNLGVKAEICESMISAIESQHIKVCGGNANADVLRHELTFFESHREVVGGVERIRYHGPQGRGEDDHDDTVISLALANWGRLHAYANKFRRKPVDLRKYIASGGGSGNAGYRFTLPGR